VTATYNVSECVWRCCRKFAINRYRDGTWSRSIRCSRYADKPIQAPSLTYNTHQPSQFIIKIYV